VFALLLELRNSIVLEGKPVKFATILGVKDIRCTFNVLTTSEPFQNKLKILTICEKLDFKKKKSFSIPTC
jgi:hypothetical protein